jgi:FkbM family methyltransferase
MIALHVTSSREYVLTVKPKTRAGEDAESSPSPIQSRRIERRTEAAKREKFFDRAQDHTPFLAVRAAGGLFFVRTADEQVGKSLFVKQERGEHRALRRVVSVLTKLLGSEALRNQCFVDVGANIGTTCINAVLVHGFGKAVAIEPEKKNFRDLRLNILLNDLEDQITSLNVVASNYVGQAELVVVPESAAGNHFVATDAYLELADLSPIGRRVSSKSRPIIPHETVSVDTITLDSLVTKGLVEPERTGLLWIDAEGSEGHILEGASVLTERGVPVVMELHPMFLERLGGLQRVMNAAAAHYTHFIDARQYKSGNFRSISDLPRFANDLRPTASSRRFTDVLLLRLGEAQLGE